MVSARRMVAIISGCLMIVACILYIISNALPRWGIYQSESEASHIGLWRLCGSSLNETICINYPITCSQELPETLPSCHKRMVARAFVTTACIVSAISILCLFACAFIPKDSKRVIVLISKVLPFASLIAGIVGVTVGIVFSMPAQNYYHIGEAAILGITALGINTVGALGALAIR